MRTVFALDLIGAAHTTNLLLIMLHSKLPEQILVTTQKEQITVQATSINLTLNRSSKYL